MNLKTLKMHELVAAEQAATIVRHKYEAKSAMYRGVPPAQDTKEFDEYVELSHKIAFFNSIRLQIIDEMEKRLTE